MGHDRQALTALAAALVMGVATAQPVLPEGEKSLVAVTRDGKQTRIGAVRFKAAGAGKATFRVQMDHAVMRDHFLSMREFKCLPAAQEITCFVPYPYAHPGTVSASDFGWLEHNLLFFFKQPADFGAKLWNGIIFKFALTPRGLVGSPQAVDLNRIGVPPENPGEPPYGRFDRDDFAPGARWIQELRIE
jgi:hypothetical protein